MVAPILYPFFFSTTQVPLEYFSSSFFSNLLDGEFVLVLVDELGDFPMPEWAVILTFQPFSFSSLVPTYSFLEFEVIVS